MVPKNIVSIQGPNGRQDMQIAHFIQRYPPALGGSESYFARLTDYLKSHGDTVTVFTSSAIDLEEMWRKPQGKSIHATAEHDGGIRRYRPLTFPLRRYFLKALSLIPIRRLQALTLPCNPVCAGMWRDAGHFEGPLDAVHATAFPYSFPIACAERLARRRKVPLFLTPFLHLGDSNDPRDRTRHQYTQPVLRQFLERATGIFVQTEVERQAVLKLGIPGERVHLQGLGVEPSECTGGDRSATRRRWKIQPEERVVGHLANLSYEKGTIDLLKANPQSRIVLAGPSMPNFERFWTTYPHKANVLRLGTMNDEERRDFYSAIDVFCLPSRSDSFGLVLLEAWANAKPVVVYRAGGPAELVRDGVDGFVVECNDRALSSAIAQTTVSMGQAGFERVHREFPWQDKLNVVRSVIQQAVTPL